MIRRITKEMLRQRLRASPVVALVGPRQCGKTTLARSLRGEYFDLEQPADKLRLDLEWDSLVTSRTLVVLDEAQSMPSVFPRIRGAVDNERRRMGRFLLLGSVSPALMTHVSESLAGRLSLIELSPFLWMELSENAARDRLWLCGGYPDGGVIARKNYPRWQADYLTLLTQRDLPAWGLPAKPQTTDRFLRMLAAYHGQVWNASKIGQSLGVNYKTVKTYLDFLIGAFLIRLLPPYHANIRKRLVKSPKIFLRDSGLLHALLTIPDYATLLTQPWVGASWEGFCIEQVIRTLNASDVPFQPYYFRTSDQHEIDLVLDFGKERWAIEFKLTSSPNPAQMEKLAATSRMIGASRSYLVSKTASVIDGGDRISCGLPALLESLVRKKRK